MIPDLSQLIVALSIAKYRRVAVQLSDSDLIAASEIHRALQQALPESNISVLGDSVTQCCLDEISAEHYGSDCIVKLGHSCWFASQRMPAYFVSNSPISKAKINETLREIQMERPSSPILLFIESSDQFDAIIEESGIQCGNIFVCVSPAVSYPGSNRRAVNWLGSGAYSSNALRSIGLQWQRLSPEFPRISGRLVFRRKGEHYEQMLNSHDVSALADDENAIFVVTSEGTLHNRLMNRFGTRAGRVLSCSSSGELSNRSNYAELLRRYKGVELVKNASVVGIVVMHSAACKELFRVRDILSRFFRAAGKEVHMFSVSKLDGVKLGNFPEIECFVVMNCPESEYFESGDLQASCVSPFEALVAVESLEWSDNIITDYDEMLARMVVDPPARTPRTPRPRKEPFFTQKNRTVARLAPAKIEMGLRGIPSRYVSEPSAQ